MSTTFTLFSCRNVCEKTLFRLDLEEECWVGRHAAYSYAVGVPMLVIYVFGLPLLAMTMIQRLQKKMRALTANSVILKENTKRSSGRGHHRWFSNVNVVNKASKSEISTHQAFGILYTSFRGDVWWWESTVTMRKILIVGIGVFGEAMGEMQVHVTAYIVVIIMMITAIVRPYGESEMLHYLELSTLTCIWMTLWAGTIFNSHPRCEDGKGGTVGWCDGLSIFIGILDILSLISAVGVIIYYKKQKQCDAFCCGRKPDDEATGAGPTFVSNPSLGFGSTKESDTEESAIEMTNVNIDTLSESGELPKGWESHETEEGEIFYEQKNLGVVTWDKPTKKGHHARASTHLPPGWNKHRDDEGTRYYSHTVNNGNGETEESTWEAPEGATGGSVTSDKINLLNPMQTNKQKKNKKT